MRPFSTAMFLTLLSWPCASWAQEGNAQSPRSDPILKGMEAEMSRTMRQLRMRHLSRPYFVEYELFSERERVLRAAFGALFENEEYRYGQMKVQTRTGSREFDNTHFAGRAYWDYGPMTLYTTYENNGDAARFDLWALTDQAYKNAVEKLSAKKAYRQNHIIAEKVADLAPALVSKWIIDMPRHRFADLDDGAWRPRISRVSSVFRNYPAIQWSRVDLVDASGRKKYFLNSEGTQFRVPSGEANVTLFAHTQAHDGMSIDAERSFHAFSPSDLPSEEALTRAAKALGNDVSALVHASTGTFYVGPVVFEGQAAAEFFNQLLAHNVSFPQPVWTENDDDKKYFETGALVDRIGTRVTSALLDAFDDPALERYDGVPLFGHYGIDDEGVPPMKLSVIEHGILKDIPMSRAPIHGHLKSNGHGRAGFNEFPTGRIGNLVITANKTVNASALRSELVRLCREQELDYGLVIRHMTTEERRESDQMISPPEMVYKVYAKDGREEPVRGLEFAEVTLRALRDIIAASKEQTVYNFYQLGPVQKNRGKVPASIVAPSILIADMELKPTEIKPGRLPYLPHPYFEAR